MLLKLPSSVIVLIGTGTSVFLSSFLLILSDLYGFVLSEYLLLTQGCGVLCVFVGGFLTFPVLDFSQFSVGCSPLRALF